MSFSGWLISLSIIPSKSIHVVTNDRTFFLIAEKDSIVYIHIYIFLIHSSVNGYLGCFHVLVTVNNAAVKWECSHLFEVLILFPLDIYPEVGLLDHLVVLFLVS